MERETYRYADFTTKIQHFTKWIRIEISDIPKLVSKYHNADIFASIQRYRLSLRTSNEDSWNGIYFDFDCKEDLNRAKADTLRVIDFFKELGVTAPFMHVYFSGHRGFHVYIEPEVFGIKPHPELTYIIKEACKDVSELCELNTFDNTVYSIPRMWRVPNSLNTKSKERQFKIELSLEELYQPVETIVELSRHPRPLLWSDIDYKNINPTLEEWWLKYVKEFTSWKDLEALKPKKTVVMENPPVCINDLLTNSIKKQGTRNRALMVIASFLKANGRTLEEATTLLIDWSKKIPADKTTRPEKERIANAKSVAKTVFRDSRYTFSCSFIKALGEANIPVDCNKTDCVYSSYLEIINPVQVNLEDTTRACYEAIPLKTQAVCAGKDYEPYLIPKKIYFECHPPVSERVDSPCMSCNLARNNYKLELDIKDNDPTILEMIDVSSDVVRGVLLRKVGITRTCRGRYTMDILFKMNVRDVQLIPLMRFTPENIGDERDYNLLQGYYIGHDLKQNKEYLMNAWLYPHPKKQHAVLLISDAQPMARTDMQITPEMIEQLKIFQYQGADPLKKMEEIWIDLESNVTKIMGRRNVSMAMDLIYHSPISFFFANQTDFVRKGWCELLIIGDTDTGKTTLARKIGFHYQLGAFVGCETTSRTGLTYSIQETNNKFVVVCGVLPLNDRGIVVLDEFRALSPEDRKEFTQMRLEGILQIIRAKQVILPARVRLIFMTAPKFKLNTYDYGINSVWEVFSEPEDIRRLDLLAIMNTTDVNPNIFYQQFNTDIKHVYTTDLCNALLRWVWNLHPKQVIFTEEAIKQVYEEVKRLDSMFVDDIPLLKIEDLRYKIARLSAALAARLFNTDDGQRLLIEKKHVFAISNFIEEIYSDKGCGYRALSKVALRRQSLEEGDKEEAMRVVKGITGAQLRRFTELMQDNRIITKSDFGEFMGWDTKTLADNFANMIRLRLLRRLSGRGGYEKTPFFIKILKEITKQIEEGLFEQ